MTPEDRAHRAWARFTNDMGEIRTYEGAVREIADAIREAVAAATTTGDQPMSDSPAKGEFDGICNRTICSNKPACNFNHSTRKYYCFSCALAINKANAADAQRLYGHDLCTPGKPTPPTGETPRTDAEIVAEWRDLINTHPQDINQTISLA